MADRELKVIISGDSKDLQRALDQGSKSSSKFGGSLKSMAKIGVAAAGAAGIGALFVTLKTGFEEIMEGQKVMAQTNAVLKATGGVANVTAKDVENLATAQSRLTGIDDELIQTGENLLLTFKNVRNEVGQGNDVFNRATKAALDLSVAGFGSVESASKMLGKALNDPIKGLSAMSRAGVTFSQSQKDLIKSLVDSGKSLEAQKIILKEVESQVGGSAKAFGDTLPGQIAKAKNAFGEVSGELATVLLPAVTKALDGFSRFMAFVQDNWPKWKQTIVTNSQPVIEVLTKIWNYIQANVIPILIKMGNIAVEYFTKVANVFKQNGPEIQRIIERVTAVIGPLIKAWLFLAENVVIPIIKPLFTVVIPTALNITIKALDVVTGVIETVVKALRSLGNTAADVFGAVRGGANAVKSALEPLAAVAQRVFGAFENAVTSHINAAISVMRTLWGIVNSVVSAIERLSSAIRSIPSLPSIDVPFVGGGRAAGGPVRKGVGYMVGERGPEFFVPNQSGTIIPNMTAAGATAMGGGSATYVFNFPHYIGDKREVVSAVRQELVRAGFRNGGGMLRGQG